MLFGRTTAQKEQAEQERLKRLYAHRTRKSAMWPVRLVDGRYAWFRTVWVEWPVGIDLYVEYYSNGEITKYRWYNTGCMYFLTET